MAKPYPICDRPRVSFLLPTYNRREIVLGTISRILGCGLAKDELQIFVIDNASSDGTADAVAARFPSVCLLKQSSNRGPCAKNAAIGMARGQFIVFLDDDSYPQPGSIRLMIDLFERQPSLGAAVFTVTLPDGSRECSAYPNVCIGCGTGFRRDALLAVGGLPDDFFMAAEEYDLSLRLLDAGWQVELFDHLHVMHLKTPGSRFPARIARLDARNNTLLAMCYFPEKWRLPYAMEWLERYRLMARINRRQITFWAGAAEGLARGLTIEHRPIRLAAFEQFTRMDEIRQKLADARMRLGLRKILLADLGKNILAYRMAASACGVEIVAIADETLGGLGLAFRGLQILNDKQANELDFDAVVISNSSPVQACLRAASWRSTQSRPVLDLLQPLPAACVVSRAAA